MNGMAGAGSGTECDAEALKRLLHDTATACQKCLVAVDSIVHNQRQTSVASTAVSLM